jgi:hypothetical protein
MSVAQCHLCKRWERHLIAWFYWYVCLPCYEADEEKQ